MNGPDARPDSSRAANAPRRVGRRRYTSGGRCFTLGEVLGCGKGRAERARKLETPAGGNLDHQCKVVQRVGREEDEAPARELTRSGVCRGRGLRVARC